MRVVKTLSLLATLGLVTLMVTGCERNITTVEHVQTASACFDCHSDSDLSLVSAEEQERLLEGVDRVLERVGFPMKCIQ